MQKSLVRDIPVGEASAVPDLMSPRIVTPDSYIDAKSGTKLRFLEVMALQFA